MKITVRYDEKIPKCRPIGVDKWGRTRFLLCSNFVYYINEKRYLIPVGYVFDGASIPWGFRNTFNPADTRFMSAALIHDWLYDTEMYPRLINDQVMRQAMIFSGEIPAWKRDIMYAAVVAGGWYSYRAEHTEKSVMAARALALITDTRRPLYDKILTE
jgi:hypothetical protein